MLPQRTSRPDGVYENPPLRLDSRGHAVLGVGVQADNFHMTRRVPHAVPTCAEREKENQVAGIWHEKWSD